MKFLDHCGDPDDLAIREAARLVAAGKKPLIQFVLEGNRVCAIRVTTFEEPAAGKMFPCRPMDLPEGVRNGLLEAMIHAAKR
jgi:hypothetical protein